MQELEENTNTLILGDYMEHFFENIVYSLAPVTISILEIIGIIIILYGSASALINFAMHKFDLRENRTKIILGEALALALEFKLGSEIIKTVIVRNLEELLILGIIVALRVILTFVIHWEVEKADLACEFNAPENYKKVNRID